MAGFKGAPNGNANATGTEQIFVKFEEGWQDLELGAQRSAREFPNVGGPDVRDRDLTEAMTRLNSAYLGVALANGIDSPRLAELSEEETLNADEFDTAAQEWYQGHGDRIMHDKLRTAYIDAWNREMLEALGVATITATRLEGPVADSLAVIQNHRPVGYPNEATGRVRHVSLGAKAGKILTGEMGIIPDEWEPGDDRYVRVRVRDPVLLERAVDLHIEGLSTPLLAAESQSQVGVPVARDPA